MSGVRGAVVERGLSSRWLVFGLGDRDGALAVDYLVKVLEVPEIFRVPFCGDRFKGVIYYLERAVPVLDWGFIGKGDISGKMVVLVEWSGELIGIEIERVKGVEEYALVEAGKEEGYWIELDGSKNIWALDIDRLFKGLREG